MAANGSRASTVPRISVIVPVFNDAGGLQRCLDALARQTLPPDELEVLVVDNGSTEDLGWVRDRYRWVAWLHEPAPGSYAARNRGLAAAQADVLGFLDADCLPEPQWARTALARLEDPTIAAVGGPVLLFAADPGRPTPAELYEQAFAFPIERYVAEDHYAVTANLAARRSAFDAVGPFRADLRSGGDREWCERLHAAGLRLAYEPAMRVAHPSRRTLAALWAKRRRVLHGDLAAGRNAAIRGPALAYLRWVANQAVRPFAETRRLRRTRPEFGWTARLRIGCVGLVLRARSVGESWRLRRGRGGSAPR